MKPFVWLANYKQQMAIKDDLLDCKRKQFVFLYQTSITKTVWMKTKTRVTVKCHAKGQRNKASKTFSLVLLCFATQLSLSRLNCFVQSNSCKSMLTVFETCHNWRNAIAKAREDRITKRKRKGKERVGGWLLVNWCLPLSFKQRMRLQDERALALIALAFFLSVSVFHFSFAWVCSLQREFKKQTTKVKAKQRTQRVTIEEEQTEEG